MSLCQALLTSAKYSAGGLLVGLLIAAILTPISGRSRVGMTGQAFAIGLKSVPAFIFPLLFGGVFGSSAWMKFTVSGLICFFPILVGAREGIARVPVGLVRLADVYGASRMRRLFFVEGPWLIGGVLEGLKAAAPLAVVGAIVAEYVDASDVSMAGLGILFATNRNAPPTLALLSVLATILGCAMYCVVAMLKRRVDRRLRLV